MYGALTFCAIAPVAAGQRRVDLVVAPGPEQLCPSAVDDRLRDLDPARIRSR